jgi:hypothetical protein
LELYEKIYVNPEFLDTEHGQIACAQCHGGNPDDGDWRTAHKDVVRDPTFPDPGETCGECHEAIVERAAASLHYTLDPIRRAVEIRAAGTDPKTLGKVRHARQRHCGTCHASCGQCHVSRPDYVKGGLLASHRFFKTPPMDTTCASCHGGRVHGEYTGAGDDMTADVHYEDEEMTCMDCHTADEMHAAATGVSSRFDLPQRPACRNCHETIGGKADGIRAHTAHGNRLACQVCHAQPAKNCFGCHVGTDQKGLPYFKCKETKMLFKIGLNPKKSKDRPYDYVALRHPPADPTLFDQYVRNGLTGFDAAPTWKLDAPHNILRKTPQNSACNNCHGNGDLFLREKDLAPWEVRANAAVVVPEDRMPTPVKGDE